MNPSSAARLLSPEEIAVRAGGEIPFLRFPERATVFGEREMRLRQLAPGHAMGEYLLFAAELARAQGEAIAAPPPLDLPEASALEAAARDGVAPLAPDRHPRDPRWTSLLRSMLARVATRLPDGPARDAVRAVADADDAWLDQQADRLVHGVTLGLDVGRAPLVAAGLQAYYTQLVLATRDAKADPRLAPFGRVDLQTRCPCCASAPTASVTRIGSSESGHRYLHCSLCSTQWHMVRIKCSNCLSTKGIAYQSLRAEGDADAADDTAPTGGASVQGAESAGRAVEIECCGECGHYLKIVHMERDPHVEPAADDLATLTLDLLASDAGLERHGHNLLLVFGDPEPAQGPP